MKYCNSIVDKAIQLVRQNPDSDKLFHLGVQAYIREYRTIIMYLPRQVGKSTYITTHATTGDIIIYPNTSMCARHSKKTSIPCYTMNQIYNMTCGNASRGRDQHTIGNNIIWLDELSQDQLSGPRLWMVLANIATTGDEIIVGLATR
jgi:hypothetical protein